MTNPIDGTAAALPSQDAALVTEEGRITLPWSAFLRRLLARSATAETRLAAIEARLTAAGIP